MQARPLTGEEIAKLRGILEDGYGPYAERDRCLFELGLNAGGRISEILALTVGQVRQYGRVVERLELVETKGGRPRAIPLNSKAKEAISAYLAWKEAQGEPVNPEAPLFRSRKGSRMTRQAAHLRLRELYRRAELQGKVTTHSLRKSFANTLDRRGVRLKVIKELLGHKSLATTDRYLSVTEEELRAAVGRLD
jgi:site-specific recombinase XerD